MNKKDPKVLIGIVTYDGKDYIFPHCYKAMLDLDYKNYDWMIVDNSKSRSYADKLRRKGYKRVHHIKRAGNSRDTISDSQNYIREFFLNGDYDYLLLLESDLVPPKHALSVLVDHSLPVVGATYFIGTGDLKLPCIFFSEYKEKDFVMGTRMIKIEEVPDYIGKGVKQVHGVGFGFALFRRDIVEDNAFWTDERFDNKHSDVYYYMNLHNKKVPVFVDTNIVVPHYPSKWEDVGDK